MLTIDELVAKWNSFHKGGNEPVYQGYDASHPLQFFVGLDSCGNREFFLIMNHRPSHLPIHSRSIEVLPGSRKDGKYTLVFRLIQPSLQEVFTHLCWDLAESSRAFKDTEKGLSKVLARYELWKRLVEKGTMGLLSNQEIKGLFGEILFLKNRLFDKYGQVRTIEGWIGPTGTDRDFVYQDFWYEVKTTNPGASTLKISSIEQLDTYDKGYLIWVQAEKTAVTDPRALSLPKLIADTKLALAEFPAAVDRFELKLLEMGYIERKEYYDHAFVCDSIRMFLVDEKFPRIRRIDLNSGIVTAAYEVSVASIRDHEAVWGE